MDQKAEVTLMTIYHHGIPIFLYLKVIKNHGSKKMEKLIENVDPNTWVINAGFHVSECVK